MPTDAQKKVNAQKARVARAMEPHYEAFGVLKKPCVGQQNQLKTEIYDSWMRWIEEQEQEDFTTQDVNAEVSKIAERVMSAAATATELTRKAETESADGAPLPKKLAVAAADSDAQQSTS